MEFQLRNVPEESERESIARNNLRGYGMNRIYVSILRRRKVRFLYLKKRRKHYSRVQGN